MRTSVMMWASMAVLMVVATGCYEVVYTAEYKGASCIKFDNALYDQDPDPVEEDWVDACLGEDGVEEVDEFIVELSDATDEVEVTVKAGKCKETVTLVWDDDEDVWLGEVCDFMIAGLPDGEIWDLGVFSDDDNKTAALSYVMFCFGDGAEVVGPEEGSYTVNRGSDYDEPTEPEEEEEEVD